MAQGLTSHCNPRPLLVRPGARFACFNDGLCCTEIHAIGPLSRSEATAMRALVKGSVFRHEGVDAPCMRPGKDGACAQREDGLCGVHKHHGAAAKPSGCRRFPFGLLSTPDGGRITTEHRCPCRTMGERPPVDPLEAERSLVDAGGRLEVDHWAPARVPLSAGRFVSFARYQKEESELIERLLCGERPEEVLEAQPLPDLQKGEWPVLAAEFYEYSDETSGGMALSWFADGLLHLAQGHLPPSRPRSWASPFAAASARTTRPEDPEAILNDWVADELWMMRWLDWDCTFDVARAELVTRVKVARYLLELLLQQGVSEDQAAAEAVMIVEIGACSERWSDLVRVIANDPSPASRFA